jgi:hypothetical protein
MGIDAPFAHDDAVVLKAAPDPHVGLVVLVGDDHFVSGFQLLAQGLGDDVGVL